MVKIDDHWVETVLISIAKKSGSDIEFAAKGDELSFSGGERDIAIRTLFNAGNSRRYTPMTLHEVTFKVYPDEADDAIQLFYGTTSTSQPLSITNTLTRDDMRVVILWTDKTTAVAAAEEIAGSNAALRYIGKNGNITKCEPFWDDGEMGFEITIKIPPYTRAGVGNNTWESTDGTATMTAVGAYS